ncbi:hypothetical protein O6H91_Y395000 [Diphasiastrum complanatum]|nr:hypothetical protein O6H91_Y395000 [Diphasiastrum complanatum]
MLGTASAKVGTLVDPAMGDRVVVRAAASGWAGGDRTSAAALASVTRAAAVEPAKDVERAAASGWAGGDRTRAAAVEPAREGSTRAMGGLSASALSNGGRAAAVTAMGGSTTVGDGAFLREGMREREREREKEGESYYEHIGVFSFFY